MCFISSDIWPKNLNLLYRATTHNFTASEFHTRCDNKKPTLVVIKNDQDQVFGGFTKQTWNHTDGYKNDPDAFLFSVTKKKKYPLK